jgi:hypothetical protein
MNAAALAASAELAESLAAPIDPREVLVRISSLKEMERSPLHYWQACQDDRDETLSMRLGAGAHALLFGKPVVLWDQPAKNGKGGKAPRNGGEWDKFVKDHPGATILNATEMAEAKAMVDGVRRNPLAMRVLADTVQEETIHWTYANRACRSTPDARSRLHVVEFKTCQSSEPSKFLKDAFWRRYHAQLAFYTDAMIAAGDDPMEAYIIAVENSAPYATSVLRLTDRALEHGRALYRQWFERLLECEAKNEWPSYSSDVLSFDVE